MMNSLIPPPERRLPQRRVADMRTRVMIRISKSARTAAPGRRVVLAAAAVAAVLAGGVVTTAVIHSDDPPQVLAFGAAAPSPDLAKAVDRCLFWNSPESRDPSDRRDPPFRVTRSDLVVSVRHGDTQAVAFVTDEGYLACDYTDSGEGSGGLKVSRWPARGKDWLPGPAEVLLLTSSELHSGEVTVVGRVSAGVSRLVLEYGNGHTSDARFGDGMFAVLSQDTGVTGDATLVSYDAAGREIGRKKLFKDRDDNACFTDPAGNIVYGKKDKNCQPASRWR
jgi:hypothetical protein